MRTKANALVEARQLLVDIWSYMRLVDFSTSTFEWWKRSTESWIPHTKRTLVRKIICLHSPQVDASTCPFSSPSRAKHTRSAVVLRKRVRGTSKKENTKVGFYRVRGMFGKLSYFSQNLQIRRVPARKKSYRTCRVRFGCSRKTLSSNRAFLRGYTRTSGKGKHFVQILQSYRVLVWEAYRTHRTAGYGVIPHWIPRAYDNRTLRNMTLKKNSPPKKIVRGIFGRCLLWETY